MTTKQDRRDRVWAAIKAGDRELALRLADELPRSYREGVELRTFVSLNLEVQS